MKEKIIPKLGPCLLVAMPQLQDPNFHQTTSLISEFNENGAMAFVLNRPMNVSIASLLEDTYDGDVSKLHTVFAYWGGPIQNDRGFVVHEDPSLEKDSVKITKDLFVSGTTETLIYLAEKTGQPNAPRFRLFLGYAGWGPAQLEAEIAQASWLTESIDKNVVFQHSTEGMWKNSFDRMGIDPNKLAVSSDKGFAN